MASFSPLPTSLSPGTQIGDYRVIRQLGQGGMATVYLARDLSLGRPVALKFPELPSRDSHQLEQFLVEARATARLAHPNVVTLFGAGQHEGRPFVALEYVEGDTLQARLRQERATVREALHIALGVARAIAAAHDAGVLHRDLKPSNVLLSKDGRVRVLDFGIARMLPTGGDGPASSGGVRSGPGEALRSTSSDAHGTPAYMAPEQWAGLDSKATDVWALGVMGYEMLAGHHPFSSRDVIGLAEEIASSRPVPMASSFRDVPTELSALVMRCLEKDPAERPSAREVVEQIETMDLRARRDGNNETSPFRALMPFREADADVFFGRDEELERLTERLRHQPMLLLVGASGVGKSSLVRAGLIPRLREQGNWTVVDLRPGPRPLEALAARLLGGDTPTTGRVRPFAHSEEMTVPITKASSIPPGPPATRESEPNAVSHLMDRLRAEPHVLSLVLNELADRTGSRVLLFVDQLEEAQALAEAEPDRQAFIAALCSAALVVEEPVRVIATLRDDFLGRIAWADRARDVLASVEQLSPPSDTALRDAILEPVRRRGYAFDDPRLVDEILDAVRGESACLPLLQFAMSVLWSRRDQERRRLLRRAYQEMGALAGALADHAERVLAGLPETQVELARALFLRLVTPQGTRRVLSREQLLGGLPAVAADVLTRLVEARLLNLRRSVEGRRDVRVEIAHESLPSMWQRMARWLQESREELVLLAEVTQAAELWERRGRRSEELWEGPALTDAKRTLQALRDPAPALAQAFISAGLTRQRARQRLRRAVLLGFLLVSALAVATSSAAAWMQRQRAQEAAKSEAESRAAQVRMLRDSAWVALAKRDIPEARAELRSALELGDDPSLRSLWERIRREPLLWKQPSQHIFYAVDFAPDGSRLAAANQNRLSYLVEPASLGVRLLQGHDDQVLSAAFLKGGDQFVTGAWNGELRRWSTTDGTSEPLTRQKSPVVDLAVSPDGTRVAAACREGGALLLDATTGKQLGAIDFDGPEALAVAFSPTGDRVAVTGAGSSAVVARAEDGARVVRIGLEAAGNGIAFSPDGRRLALALANGIVVVADARGGEVVQRFSGHGARARTVAFLPDGDRVVSGGHDEMIRFWSSASGRSLGSWTSDVGYVLDLALNREGELLASAGTHGLALWQVPTTSTLQPRAGGRRGGGYFSLAFSPDGESIVSGGGWSLATWDAQTGAPRQRVTGEQLDIRQLRFTPDGKRVVMAHRSGLVAARELATGRVLVEYGRVSGDLEAVALLPELDRVVAAGTDGQIVVWQDSTRRQERVLHGHTGRIWSLERDSSGRRLLTGGSDGTVRLWDTSTWRDSVLLKRPAPQRGVAFSPDGRSVATVGEDGVLTLVDLATRSERTLGRHGARLYGVTFSPDGRDLAVACADGNAYLWDLTQLSHTVLRGHRAEVNGVAFSPDGSRLATTGDDGTVRVWRVGDGRPVAWGTGLVGREQWRFGADGWQRPGSLGGPERPTEPWVSSLERSRASSWRAESLCVVDADDSVEYWEPQAKRPTWRRHVASVQKLVATGRGCAVLAERRAEWLDANGERNLAPEAMDVSLSGDELLVLAPASLIRLTADATSPRQSKAPEGTCAALTQGSATVWGYRDGTLELRTGSVDAVSGRRLRDTGRSPITVLASGPAGLLLAGSEEGLAGVWDLASGQRMHHGYLHGAVSDAASDRERAVFVSELGDSLVIDLGGLGGSYCDFLRSVWRQVPYAWGDGQITLVAPPPDHPCSEAQR